MRIISDSNRSWTGVHSLREPRFTKGGASSRKCCERAPIAATCSLSVGASDSKGQAGAETAMIDAPAASADWTILRAWGVEKTTPVSCDGASGGVVVGAEVATVFHWRSG